jgi:hypothetical protein
VKKIERLPALNEISWCIEDAPLVNLSGIAKVEHVTSIYLVECRKLTSLFGIAERFPKLKSLWVYSCDRLSTLEGLQSLKELQNLTIWPSFSGTIKIDTLLPLASTLALQNLVFAGTSKDGTLTPLYGLKRLERLFVSNNFSWDQFAHFEAQQPNVDFPWKGGVVFDANPAVLTCQSCGRPKAMLTGKGNRLCCPDCDGGRLSKHIKRYRELSHTR